MCQPAAAAAATKPAAKDYDDLFDDDDDDAALMDEGLSDTKSPVKKPPVDQEDADDDDFLMPATGRIRNRGAILDDENSMGERRERVSDFSLLLVDKDLRTSGCLKSDGEKVQCQVWVNYDPREKKLSITNP